MSDANRQLLRFDARPIGLLLLARGWRILVLVIVLGCLAWALLASRHLPEAAVPGVMSGPALRAIAIFAAAVCLWVTSAVPLVV